MTPRHAAPPDPHDRTMSDARELSALLAVRHNIPADVHDLPTGVVVSVFAGLIARVGPAISWDVPDLTGERTKPLKTFAYTPEAAADRLAEHYHQLRSVPLAELLTRKLITPLAAALLEPEVRHAAVGA